MSAARYIVGDVFDVLATLPDASVDLVFTSPPFLALRSYLPADHPDKSKEIGSEPTPGEFIDTLLDVVVECRRVLAPHGSLVFELGDTFAGSGGAGGDYNADGLRDGQQKFSGSASKRVRLGVGDDYRPSRAGRDVGWPLDKSLCLIPQSFAWALSYGRNPFTGREIEPWRVRNVVAWCRPNPPVGALGDKFRPATSYLTVACTSRARYFDLDAVRTETERFDLGGRRRGNPEGSGGDATAWREGDTANRSGSNPAGAPPLDYWVIPTHPYKNAHYATFPPALCIKPIEAMCPRKVCRVCGEPSRRITSVEYEPHGVPEIHNAEPKARADVPLQQRSENAQGMAHGRATKNVETLGWSDCGCRCETDCQGCAEGLPGDFEALEPASGWPPCTGKWRPGVVLDPFAGSGTTLEVATGHGRDAIGIDLDARNAELAYERIGGLFLTIESAQSAA